MKKEMIRNVICGAFAFLLSLSAASAQSEAGALSVAARVGFGVGGTAPVGLPAEIRGLNGFHPRANLSVGADVCRKFSSTWGAQLSLRFENKGMWTDADVKGYSMEMRKGGDAVSGVFTGGVVTEVDQWMFTIPLMAAAEVRKVRVHAGPYVSFLVSRDFSGYAYDGYIRQGAPTGPKVMIGSEPGSRGDYDFSDDMRKAQFGLMAGADWAFLGHLGAYLDLSWGLTGVFHSSFKTIEQTMYPIYGTVGLFYRFN